MCVVRRGYDGDKRGNVLGERECLCVSVCMYVCKRERERAPVRVYVCVRERGEERERDSAMTSIVFSVLAKN